MRNHVHPGHGKHGPPLLSNTSAVKPTSLRVLQTQLLAHHETWITLWWLAGWDHMHVAHQDNLISELACSLGTSPSCTQLNLACPGPPPPRSFATLHEQQQEQYPKIMRKSGRADAGVQSANLQKVLGLQGA
eukprot:1154330-Pelagomonas_calceolata.AAC.5